MAERPSIVLAAGGSGGNVYPGLAVADAIQRAAPGARVTFVGTQRGMETRLVPEAGYRLHTIDMIPFVRTPGTGLHTFPKALVKAGMQCKRVLRVEGAHAAAGMGGYTTAPLVLGAKLAGLPSLIHEANAVPGRANTLASRLTPNIALAFDATAPHFDRPGRLVGMPLLPHLDQLDASALRAAARTHFHVPEGVFFLLVSGGSRGAQRLNEAAVELAGIWRDRTDVRILVKAGDGAAATVNDRLAALGADHVATAVDYLDRMDLAYAAADLAVCRSGAATVAELSQAGLPSVLVPYPHTAHEHQTHNAGLLARRGAAVLLPNGEVSGERLDTLIGNLRADPTRLPRMADAAAGLAYPGAAGALAEWLLALAAPRLARP